jgi:hypothetical protein
LARLLAMVDVKIMFWLMNFIYSSLDQARLP